MEHIVFLIPVRVRVGSYDWKKCNYSLEVSIPVRVRGGSITEQGAYHWRKVSIPVWVRGGSYVSKIQEGEANGKFQYPCGCEVVLQIVSFRHNLWVSIPVWVWGGSFSQYLMMQCHQMVSIPVWVWGGSFKSLRYFKYSPFQYPCGCEVVLNCYVKKREELQSFNTRVGVRWFLYELRECRTI